MTPEILYEDDTLLAIAKPTQMHSTYSSAETGGSPPLANENLISFLFHEKKYPLPYFLPHQDFGLLNRLDYETSGIVLIAKTKSMYESLKKAWKAKEVTKTYRALISPKAPLPTLPFSIQHPITQRYRHSKKVIVYEEKMKKLKLKILEAHTRILKTHPHPWAQDLEIQIFTGVRHQIRAHLGFLNLPILGDTLYGTDEPQNKKSPRLFLHAWRIELPHLKHEIECPLPILWKEAFHSNGFHTS